MSGIQLNLKKWISLIQSEQLTEVIQAIQNTATKSLDPPMSNGFFKMLLHLSHTANKCDKRNVLLGTTIFELTHTLCAAITEIPNNDKYFSSLYHIIHSLLEMNMYTAAEQLCDFLRTTKLNDSEKNFSDKLVKIAHLWYNQANKAILNILQAKDCNDIAYKNLNIIVQSELNIVQKVYKNYSKYMLVRVDAHLEKIALLAPDHYFNEYYKHILDCLMQKLYVYEQLNEDCIYDIYRYILRIISHIIRRNTVENHIHSMKEILEDYCNHIKVLLLGHKECYSCFQYFQSICLALLKPVEQLTHDCVINIQSYVTHYLQVTKKYGYTGAIKWTVLIIAQILEQLLTYWEKCLKLERKQFLENNILLELMEFVVSISTLFNRQMSEKCMLCKRTECAIRNDMYNIIVMKTICVSLISKLSVQDITRDICRKAYTFLEENIASIYELKKAECIGWLQMWPLCGTLLYNMGIVSEQFYQEGQLFYSLLCSSIISFEGVQSSNTYIKLKNPICSTLHRLSVIHYTHEMYREAMTVSAVNALLSYNDVNSKAFRMWTNIKYKCITYTKTIDTSMSILECLRMDNSQIKEIGLHLDLSKYDLIQLCMREAQALQEAKVHVACAFKGVLKELRLLHASPLQYGLVVQALGYHSLSFEHSDDILEYLNTAISDFLKIKDRSASVLYLQANLQFYMFIKKLHEISNETQREMENKAFPLYASRLSDLEENEFGDVIPSYRRINIKEDLQLMEYLQNSLSKWNKCFKNNITEIVENWQPAVALHILILLGEYCRLYRYQDCEINAWTLAYVLATELNDYRTIIYVTSRSISLRYINYKWIAVAKEYATNLGNSDKEDVIAAIATFWISLSDFYFECGQCTEARCLLQQAKKLPGISFSGNVSVYLLYLDTIMCNCYLYEQEMDHETYSLHVVDILYTMVKLNDNLSTRKWSKQAEHLFGYDTLFTATVNLSIRLNSLLSFREITAYLVTTLKSAQALMATIRVAEILKSLCLIDLSRIQLDDCEVKLQALEHILNTETYQMTMNTKLPDNTQLLTPIQIVDPVRDVAQNDTSPVLRKKVFAVPNFVLHSDCNCYMCHNKSYQYLVFASAHIRAQMFALQNYVNPALEHFHGAFRIRQQLFQADKSVASEDISKENDTEQQFSWQMRYYIVDYVLLLLNFSTFLKNNVPRKEERYLTLVVLAMDVCEAFNLQGHPVYICVQELIFQSRFDNAFSSFSKFTVPDLCDIDVSAYTFNVNANKESSVTPVTLNMHKRMATASWKNKLSPTVTLPKLTTNFNDENTISTPKSIHINQKSYARPVRRKILEEDYAENGEQPKAKISPPKNKSLSKKSITKENAIKIGMVKDVIHDVASLVPSISDVLNSFTDDLNVPVTNENLKGLIETFENLKINKNHNQPGKSIKAVNSSKGMPRKEFNKYVDEAIIVVKQFINNVETNSVLNVSNDAIVAQCAEFSEISSSRNVSSVCIDKQSIDMEQNCGNICIQDNSVKKCNTNSPKNLWELDKRKSRARIKKNVPSAISNTRKASLRNSKDKAL